MGLSLPSNPDLERFRRDARRLQHAVTARMPEALELVCQHHPVGSPSADATFQLADAPLVVARSYGLAGWPQLRDFLRRSSPLRRDPTALTSGLAGADPTADVPVLACLGYDENDEPARWARAAQLLERQRTARGSHRPAPGRPHRRPRGHRGPARRRRRPGRRRPRSRHHPPRMGSLGSSRGRCRAVARPAALRWRP